MARTGPLLLATIAVSFFGCVNSAEYLGKFLGQLSQLHHGVSGEVYAVDGRTLHIKDFTYDGQGPAAYFYASTYKTADSRGFRLRDENNNGDVIRRYRKEHVTLTLPEGKTLNNIKIFYVWCEEFDVNFGDVKIPRNFDFPRPQKIDALKGVHSISSDNIVIVDAQTLLIPNLHYDGEAPDAKFWVGRGPKPSPQGIRVMDENGKELPLRRYDGKTIVLTLPGDLTVFDIGHFGIWCEQFTVDFGHIQIPQTLNIPPSLKMLGVSPQSKLNCEVLDDKLAFEVRWAVAGESIVLQLVAKLDNREYMSFGLSGDDSKTVMVGGDVVVAWVDKETLKGYAQDYYLADKSQCSGPTGSCPDTQLGEHTNNIRLLNAAMVNGYSIVTYQRPLKASDEFDLPIYTNQSQAIIWAIGPLNQRDEVSFHSSYLKRNNLIDFARPAKWNCPLPEGETGKPALLPNRQAPNEELAEPIPTQSTQTEEPEEPVTTPAPRREGGNRRRGGGTRIATRRPVTNTDGAEEGQASIREPTRTRGSNRVNQRGTQSRTVPPPTPVNNRDAWYIPPIQCHEPEDGVLYAQMGPTGGKRGYPAITGHVGWGISWYINGLLIPEINVVRGKTYTFVVEGGQDPEISAKYHPFYITDDPVGGYAYKTPEERKQVRILAGATQAKDGSIIPTGTGRLCHWTHTGDSDADDFDSFGAYQRTLQLKCDPGEPGFIQWTPDRDTPDTVYYQCFTHRYLGWKINVLDSCDSQGAASEPKPIIVEAPKSNIELFADESNVELEASASIQQEIRVIPNNIITEENLPNNKKSQPTISETPSTLDPPTPTGQSNSDKIQNTSFLFQSQQNHLINPLSQVNSYALPYTYHTSGHYNNNNKDASSFRPSPTIDNFENFPVDDIFKKSVGKEMTTTEIPLTRNISSKLKTQTVSNINPSITYIALPLNMISKHTNKHFKVTRPTKQPLQVLYLPLPTNNQHLQYSTMPYGYKKPIFRPRPEKMHTSVIYNIQPELNVHPILKTLPNKQHLSINTIKVSSIQTQSIPKTLPMEEIKNVEISPKQASTEREPDIQTSSPLISIFPTPDKNFNFKTPANTGFNPGSVVIEGGFKPIIGKHIEDRIDQINPKVDLEGQTGVIEVKGKKFEQNNQNKNLKTALISPPTNTVIKKKHKKIFKEPIKKEIVKIIVRTRSLIDSDIEPEMAAADRVESYYLPPPGQTEKPKVSVAKQPSEIDFEAPLSNTQSDSAVLSKISDSPPDIVVTYDGKRVSGASLTAKPFEKSTILQQRGSKAAELIKAYPQFIPFRGDLPPLNPNVLFDVKPHNTNTHPGVLSRSLDTPLPPSVGSTKLTRVRRAAHHTAEHTAEQMRQLNQTTNSTITSGSESLMQCSFVSLVFSMALLQTFVMLTL